MRHTVTDAVLFKVLLAMSNAHQLHTDLPWIHFDSARIPLLPKTVPNFCLHHFFYSRKNAMRMGCNAYTQNIFKGPNSWQQRNSCPVHQQQWAKVLHAHRVGAGLPLKSLALILPLPYLLCMHKSLPAATMCRPCKHAPTTSACTAAALSPASVVASSIHAPSIGPCKCPHRCW